MPVVAGPLVPRVSRTMNTTRFETVVEDPEYLAAPWKITPSNRPISTDPNATLYEPLPCLELDRAHTTSHVRSG